MPKPLDRRYFLRSTSVAMALPLLEAMQPSRARAGFTNAPVDDSPHRMFCICTNMGMMPDFFRPQGSGFNYVTSEYLNLIDAHRDVYTVFSGVSHPDVDGGHHAEISYLTGAPHPASGGFKNSISLDQFAAERVGLRTRFPYLSLCVGSEHNTLSWTASGVRIPAESRPSDVYRKMFVQGNQAAVERQIAELRAGRSVLDTVAERAQRLSKRLGALDRTKLDEYLDSVRELEQRLVKAEEWERYPKPKVNDEPPVDIEDHTALIERCRLMYSMAKLAMQTDSTRIVTLVIDQNTNPKVNLPGVSEGHHSLTHHGHREESVAQLKIIESAQTRVFGELLQNFKDVREEGGSLLDRTMILYGSNLGNANSHDNKNLPLILAGGGFRHGQHLVFDSKHNYPMANLFVSMLQRVGIEVETFASASGSMRGLEFS